MEVDEKPTEEFNDVGGLDAQIQELIEAVVLPMTHKERFDNIGIKPPKGALMYGPPGTGKTLMARACAARTQACFLKLAGPQLVQMFIGDGAKLVCLASRPQSWAPASCVSPAHQRWAGQPGPSVVLPGVLSGAVPPPAVPCDRPLPLASYLRLRPAR